MRWIVISLFLFLSLPLHAQLYKKWEEKRGELNEYEKAMVRRMKEYEAGEEEKVRSDTILELSVLDDYVFKKVRPELLEDVKTVVRTALTSDAKWKVRVQAPAALVALKAKEALDDLLKVARRDRKKDVRAASVDAIAKLADRGDKRVIKVLGEILTNDKWSIVRAAAVEALTVLGGVSEMDKIRRAAAEDPYSTVRAAAIEAMIKMNDRSDEAKSIAKKALEDEYSRVRAAACALCEHLRLKEATEKLISLLDDKKQRVRLAAMRALKPFLSEKHLPMLEKKVKEVDDEEVLCELISMLGAIGTKEALSIIADNWLNSKDPDIKAEASVALASRGDRRGIEEVKKMLSGNLAPFRKEQLLVMLLRDRVEEAEILKAVERLAQEAKQQHLKKRAEEVLKALKGDKGK